MKQTRKAHLWIGLICSIFIFMESITGLIMNEPWLIGQTQSERGNFQRGQMDFPQQGASPDLDQQSAQTQGWTNGQSQNNADSQALGQNGSSMNGQFPGQDQGQGPGLGNFNGRTGFKGGEAGQGSLMGIIRGLHEGRIGTTNIKWLIDLTAIAMIFLTGTGIYLSIKVLAAGKRRKKRKSGDGSSLGSAGVGR